MSIETRLRESAERIRDEAVQRAKELESPQPRGFPRLIVAVTAVAVVVLFVAVVTVTPRAPSDDPATTVSTTTLGEPLPEGWTKGTLPSVGVEYWVPEEGWQVIEESLTPHLDLLPGDPDQRYIGTIISFATFEAEPAPRASFCAQNPQGALDELGATDALVSVLEYRQILVPELPNRLRATGIYEGTPEDYYPYVGEVIDDACYDRANQGRDGDLFHRKYIFHDNGRAFAVTVAFGPDADNQTQLEVWTILDNLEFRPSS